MNYRISLAVLALAGIVSGCASNGVRNPEGVPVTEMRPDDRGFVAGTGVESQDLVGVTDKMARSIVGIPQIANAQGQPRIIVDPVKNETRFPINKDMFLTRIRVQLNSKAQGKVIFLARDRMAALEHERQLKQSGLVTPVFVAVSLGTVGLFGVVLYDFAWMPADAWMLSGVLFLVGIFVAAPLAIRFRSVT